MGAANRLLGETTSVEHPAGGAHDRRSTDGSCGIAIMAKASAPGRAKTRLAPPKLDPHTPYYPAATATLMHSLGARALIGDRPESVPQIPLRSA
jgi:hypothetical protein